MVTLGAYMHHHLYSLRMRERIWLAHFTALNMHARGPSRLLEGIAFFLLAWCFFFLSSFPGPLMPLLLLRMHFVLLTDYRPHQTYQHPLVKHIVVHRLAGGRCKSCYKSHRVTVTDNLVMEHSIYTGQQTPVPPGATGTHTHTHTHTCTTTYVHTKKLNPEMLQACLLRENRKLSSRHLWPIGSEGYTIFGAS